MPVDASLKKKKKAKPKRVKSFQPEEEAAGSAPTTDDAQPVAAKPLDSDQRRKRKKMKRAQAAAASPDPEQAVAAGSAPITEDAQPVAVKPLVPAEHEFANSLVKQAVFDNAEPEFVARLMVLLYRTLGWGAAQLVLHCTLCATNPAAR